MKKKIILIGIPAVLLLFLIAARVVVSSTSKKSNVPGVVIPGGDNDVEAVQNSKSNTEVIEEINQDRYYNNSDDENRKPIGLNFNDLSRKKKKEGDDDNKEKEEETTPVNTYPSSKKQAKNTDKKPVENDAFGSTFSLNENSGDPKQNNNTEILSAVVHDDQKIKNGSFVSFRLTKAAVVGGIPLKRNTVFTGKAQLQGDRVYIQVNRIRAGAKYIKTSLDCYDSDQIPGIHVPEGALEDVIVETGEEIAGSFIDNLPFGTLARTGRKLLANLNTGDAVYLTDGYQVSFSKR